MILQLEAEAAGILVIVLVLLSAFVIAGLRMLWSNNDNDSSEE